jgi:MFS family permease
MLCALASSGSMARVGFAVIGLGLASVFPLAISAAAQRRDRPAAAAVAAISTAGYSGFLAGPAIIGLLASLFGLRAGLGVLVLLGVRSLPGVVFKDIPEAVGSQRSQRAGRGNERK